MHAAIWQQCICLEPKVKALSLAVCSFPAGKLLQSLVQVEITPAFLSLNGWQQSRPPVTKHKEGTASSSRASVSAWRTEVFEGIQGSMMTSSVQDALPQAFWYYTYYTTQCGEVFHSAKLRIDTFWSQPEKQESAGRSPKLTFKQLHDSMEAHLGIQKLHGIFQSKRIWHRKLVDTVDTPRQIMSNKFLEFWLVCVGVCVLPRRKLGGVLIA